MAKSSISEQFSDKLLEIITSIQTAVGKAADFTFEQLPDIAQQYVAFGRAYSITVLVVSLIFMGFFWYLGNMINKRCQGTHESDSGWVMVFPGMLPLLVFLLNLKETILVWFAPKVWLIQEIANLIGKMK